MRITLALAALTVLSTTGAWAQSVLSAKSGTIHHVDGKAYISGVDLKPLKTGEFPALEVGQLLTTEDAHAEVLLTPGVFLRVGENSKVELLSNKLTDTKVRVHAGSVLVEAGEILPDNNITVLVGETYRVKLTKIGLYRLDAAPDRVRVFEGKVEVALASDGADARPVTLKKGREVSGAALTTAKFNAKASDELFAWSRNRSALIASANVTAARAAVNRGGSSLRRSSYGSWVFLPTYGLYTFLPGSGMYLSPFGFGYYSPAQLYIVTRQPVYPAGGFGSSGNAWGGMGSSARGGYAGGGGGGSYSSVGATSAPTMSAGSAPSAGTATGGGGRRGGQ